MSDTRRVRVWTLAGAFALALTAGVASQRAVTRRDTRAAFVAEEDLRDAVGGARMPATAGLAGKPVPTSWFKTARQHHAEMDEALLSSRHRRAAATRAQ